MKNHIEISLLTIPCLFFIYSSIVVAQIELTFGLYKSDKPTVMVKKFRPILNELETALAKRLHEPVAIKIHIAKTYSGGVADIVQGKVDFSRLGPASYVTAKKEQPALTLLAMESKKGKKTFNGVICVKKDSPIKRVTDIKGKRFAFGNQDSTIGRYLAQQFLYNSGIRLSDLKHYAYHKRHDQVAYVVAEGNFDAGALKESTYKRLHKKGLQLKKLVTFKNVTKPWVARAGLPAKQLAALQQALLNFHTVTSNKKYQKNHFVKGTDTDYAVIRKAILDNNRFNNR